MDDGKARMDACIHERLSGRHDICEANGTEKKRSGFEVTAATECVGSSNKFELLTVVQVINNNSDVIQYVVLKVHVFLFI